MKAILKAQYGQKTENVNGYIRNINELTIITAANPSKVKQFLKQQSFNVQSLGTLGGVADIKGNMTCTQDNLKGVKANHVRENECWNYWDFKDLSTELQNWTQINLVEENAVERSVDN